MKIADRMRSMIEADPSGGRLAVIAALLGPMTPSRQPVTAVRLAHDLAARELTLDELDDVWTQIARETDPSYRHAVAKAVRA